MTLTGSNFETLVKPFFENLFKEIGFIVTEVRNQKSGTQNGFDIMVEFNDSSGTKRNIFIECKYYSSELRWSTIFNKQVHLKGSNYQVDGFIVLSPKENLTNIDHNLQNVVSNMFGFPVDFWTPDNGIENIFSLDKSLYEVVYNKACTLTVDKTEQLDKVKVLIQNLLNEKDNPTSKIPPKKRNYSKPDVYIKRSVASSPEELFASYFGDKKSLNEIIKTNNKIALLGGAGTGKSIELEQLAYELSSPDIFDYPFLIKLNIHTDESIADRIPEINSIPNNLIVLLLDGLDEVQAENIETIRRKVLRFSEDYPEAKLIVSCRSNFYTTVSKNGELNTLPGFSSFQLVELQWKDIDDYLSQNIPMKKDRFLNDVSDKQLEKLLYIPYYLIKLVEQYQNNGAIANSKAELFENVITENINKDAARYYSIDRDIKARLMRRLLEKLAFILEYQGKNHCIWTELTIIFPSSSDLELIKRSASLLDKNEGSEEIWKFSHNNIQEYLVAKVLSERKLEEIKKIIAFKPKYKKIKPTWVNSLSFLISILEKKQDLRSKLITWINENEPELIVKFEPDKLNDTLRFQIFEKIFNHYEKEKRRINETKYNFRQLSLFSFSEQAVKFLIEKIQHNTVAISKSNALELIAFFDIERKFPQFVSAVKQLIESILYYETDEDLIFLSIRTYITLFKLSESEFEKLLNKFNESQNTFIRHIIFTAIYHQNYQDKYISIIIVHTKKLMETERESNENRLSNEYYDLKECLVNAKSLDAIKKILLFIKDDYYQISNSIYFKEVIKEILEFIAQEYPNNMDFYGIIKEIFSSNIKIYDVHISTLIEFFEVSGKRMNAFVDIYHAKYSDLNHEALALLAFLANENEIKFLANEFKKGKIDKKSVEDFQWELEWNNKKYITLFNSLINENEKIELPTYKYDLEKEKKENLEKTMLLLSDKDKFKEAIEQVFIDGGKDDLTFDEIRNLHTSMSFHSGKYLNIIWETVSQYKMDSTINKTDLLTDIEVHWDIFSIRKINHFLKMDKSVMLTEELVSYIKKWCDEITSQSDFSFKSGIYYVEPGHVNFNRDIIMLSSFIRRLRFISYSQDFYLDLLSFPKLDDETEIIDFVETIVPKEEIDKRIILNLSENISISSVLEGHVTYCVINRLNQTANLLLPYLQNENTYNRYKLLDAFVKLNGSINKLEQILPRITDEFKFNIVHELIKQKSKVPLQYILSLFSSANDKEEKIKLAKYLIQMQNIKGLKYYIQFIKENCYLPDDSSPSNPLFKLTHIRAIPLIINLYELAFDEEIKQGRFSDLKTIAATAFQSISLNPDNYFKAKRYFYLYKLTFNSRAFFNKKKLPEKIIQDLSYFFENISQQYYVNKSENVSLDDAINISKILKLS